MFDEFASNKNSRKESRRFKNNADDYADDWESHSLPRPESRRAAPIKNRDHLDFLQKDIDRLFKREVNCDISAANSFIDKANSFLDKNIGLLNHVMIADISHRLCSQLQDEICIQQDPRRQIAIRLMDRFLENDIRPGPREISTMIRCAGLLFIEDSRILDPLSRKIGRLINDCKEADLSFSIIGLSASATRSSQVENTLEHLCAVFERAVKSGSIDTASRLIEILKTFARRHLFHQGLVQAINTKLFDVNSEGKRVFDTLELLDQTLVLRCNAILGKRLPEQVDRLTEQLERKLAEEGPRELASSLDSFTIASYVAAVALLDTKRPQKLIAQLEELFHSEPLSRGSGRMFSRTTSLAIPAFMLLLDTPSVRTRECFFETKLSPGELEVVSKFEYDVRDVVRELQLPYEHQSSVGLYSVDFLIKRWDDKFVNLECDGDMYHRLYDLSARQLTDYRGEDELRDRVMRKQGYLVARILAGEMEFGPDAAKFLRQKIAEAR